MPRPHRTHPHRTRRSRRRRPRPQRPALEPAWAGALDRPDPAAPPLALPPEGFDIHPDAGKPTVVSTPLPDAALVPNHTGSPPVTVNPGDLREEFPALQPQGPTIMDMATPPHVRAAKGYPGTGVTPRGGPTFAGTSYLFPVKPGEKNTVTIKLSGSRTADFRAANKAAGLTSLVPHGANAPTGFTWHHVDDYKSTLVSQHLSLWSLQLIKRPPLIQVLWHNIGL